MIFKTLKKSYENKFTSLKNDFLKKHNSINFLKKNSKLCDDVITTLWRSCSIDPEKYVIAAVGGFGRNELYPGSDIDLAIISNSEATDVDEKEKLELFIQHCWDFGFKIGISQRIISEIHIDIKDITIATNLLELRHLAGCSNLFFRYKDTLIKKLNINSFIKNKIKEQDERHLKFSKSGYLLEPNIKESRGCLRDIHFIRWLTAAKYGSHEFKTLIENKVIELNQYNLLKFHFNKIAKRRIFLHIITNQQEDRLLVDYQSRLAEDLGFKNTPSKKASENVMNSLYRSIRNIILLNEIITKKFMLMNENQSFEIPGYKELYVKNNLIEIKPKSSTNISQQIFDYFKLYQDNKTFMGFGPELINKIQESVNQDFNKTFKSNNLMQSKFINLFKSKNKVNRTLRLLNRYNILGNFFPPFGKIISQMQHDLFHIYTVDEHTLNVIENLRRYSKQKLKHEFPESYDAFKRIKKPEILYFAGLFHDIGKGRGGDHSKIGEKEVLRFGKKFQLSSYDTNLIAWLVRNHLLMSNVAQKMDLADPTVIRNFAKEVNNIERLDLLYLLTTADIRGTSHKVWNQWKSTLINNLHQITLRYLNHTQTEQQFIEQRINETKLVLKKYSISEKMFQSNWEQLGNEYFKRFDAHEIAWQTRVLLPHIKTKDTIVRVRHQKGGQGIEVLIYSIDRPGIFYKTCSFFHGIQCRISQAKIYTSKNHYALNAFHVSYDDENTIRFKDFFKYIEEELTQLINNKNLREVKTIVNLERTRQAKFHQIEDSVELVDGESGCYHVMVKTSNRDGLLLSIAQVFLKNELNIINAKITTMGERIEDHFDFVSKSSNFNRTDLENSLKKLLA